MKPVIDAINAYCSYTDEYLSSSDEINIRNVTTALKYALIDREQGNKQCTKINQEIDDLDQQIEKLRQLLYQARRNRDAQIDQLAETRENIESLLDVIATMETEA